MQSRGVDLGPTGRMRGRGRGCGRGREVEVQHPNQFARRLTKYCAIQLINLGAIQI